MTTFTVQHDTDYGWIVCDASVAAKSFTRVPVDHRWSYEYRDQAEQQAAELSRLAGLKLRMLETPDRFEAWE